MGVDDPSAVVPQYARANFLRIPREDHEACVGGSQRGRHGGVEIIWLGVGPRAEVKRWHAASVCLRDRARGAVVGDHQADLRVDLDPAASMIAAAVVPVPEASTARRTGSVTRT